MRAARHVALAAAVAATPACAGPAPCAPGFNRLGEMPDLDMFVGDTVETPLEDYFAPRPLAECSRGEFVASSTDSAAVAVSVSGILLTTAAFAVADSVRVTVKSTRALDDDDPDYHEFLVRVRPPSAGR